MVFTMHVIMNVSLIFCCHLFILAILQHQVSSRNQERVQVINHVPGSNTLTTLSRHHCQILSIEYLDVFTFSHP